MDTYEVLTVIAAAAGVLVAAGSLVVSILSFRSSASTRVRTQSLQEKQEELADLQLKLHKAEMERLETEGSAVRIAQSADIRVSLEGTAASAHFVIRNWGYGAATNVNVEVIPLKGNSSPLVKGDADEKLPIPRLAPGSDCSLIAALSFDTGVAFDVSWTWSDEDGTQRAQSSRVSL